MKTLRIILFSLLFSASFLWANNFRFQVGAGVNSLTPLVAVAGVGYNQFIFRAQGMGFYKGKNDFWVGAKGSLLYNFFEDLPFNLEVGFGGGYEYAEAPNKMHQALNNANNTKYVYPYNFKERLDLSVELWAHIYGFYSQLGAPIYRFKKHDTHYLSWGAGYIYEF